MSWDSVKKGTDQFSLCPSESLILLTRSLLTVPFAKLNNPTQHTSAVHLLLLETLLFFSYWSPSGGQMRKSLLPLQAADKAESKALEAVCRWMGASHRTASACH